MKTGVEVDFDRFGCVKNPERHFFNYQNTNWQTWLCKSLRMQFYRLDCVQLNKSSFTLIIQIHFDRLDSLKMHFSVLTLSSIDLIARKILKYNFSMIIIQFHRLDCMNTVKWIFWQIWLCFHNNKLIWQAWLFKTHFKVLKVSLQMIKYYFTDLVEWLHLLTDLVAFN